MKKMTVLRTILILTLTAFLLYGCGNSKDEAPAKEVPEVAAEEEVTEEPEKEEEQEAQQPAEEETLAEEEVAEEPKKEETSTDMPEAQVTTTVENWDGLLSYVEPLDPSIPHIIIYNEAEGYIIDMKEGEYYHLKSDDRIFLNASVDTYYMVSIPTSKDYINHESYIKEIIPDYSQFSNPQKVGYGVSVSKPEELSWIICNLIPSTE